VRTKRDQEKRGPAKTGLEIGFPVNRAANKESRAGRSVAVFAPELIPLQAQLM
jgi:hypothetical protein